MKFSKILSFLLAILIVAAFSGCDMITEFFEEEEEPSQSQSSAPEILEPVDPNWPVNAFGVEIAEKPEGVAVASPALAEYIFDMGLLNNVSGVADYCNFSGASGLPTIGSVQLPNLEAIKELAPEYILTFAQYEESILVAIQQMNIEVIVIEAPQSLDSLRELYRQIALFFGGAVDGIAMGDSYVAEYDSALSSLAYPGEEATVGFVRSLDFMMITGGTMENELLSIAGFNNAAGAESNYTFPEDKWKEFDPSVIFVNSHIHIIDLENSEYYKKKTAVKGDKIYGVDFDAVALCSKRSMAIIKDMLATVYPDYTNGAALSPAYPSMYTK